MQGYGVVILVSVSACILVTVLFGCLWASRRKAVAEPSVQAQADCAHSTLNECKHHSGVYQDVESAAHVTQPVHPSSTGESQGIYPFSKDASRGSAWPSLLGAANSLSGHAAREHGGTHGPELEKTFNLDQLIAELRTRVEQPQASSPSSRHNMPSLGSFASYSMPTASLQHLTAAMSSTGGLDSHPQESVHGSFAGFRQTAANQRTATLWARLDAAEPAAAVGQAPGSRSALPTFPSGQDISRNPVLGSPEGSARPRPESQPTPCADIGGDSPLLAMGGSAATAAAGTAGSRLGARSGSIGSAGSYGPGNQRPWTPQHQHRQSSLHQHRISDAGTHAWSIDDFTTTATSFWGAGGGLGGWPGADDRMPGRDSRGSGPQRASSFSSRGHGSAGGARQALANAAQRRELAHAARLVSGVLKDMRVLQCLGAGAHGRVYKAAWSRPGAEDLMVAVKIIQLDGDMTPGAPGHAASGLGPMQARTPASMSMFNSANSSVEGPLMPHSATYSSAALPKPAPAPVAPTPQLQLRFQLPRLSGSGAAGPSGAATAAAGAGMRGKPRRTVSFHESVIRGERHAAAAPPRAAAAVDAERPPVDEEDVAEREGEGSTPADAPALRRSKSHVGEEGGNQQLQVLQRQHSQPSLRRQASLTAAALASGIHPGKVLPPSRLSSGGGGVLQPSGAGGGGSAASVTGSNTGGSPEGSHHAGRGSLERSGSGHSSSPRSSPQDRFQHHRQQPYNSYQQHYPQQQPNQQPQQPQLDKQKLLEGMVGITARHPNIVLTHKIVTVPVSGIDTSPALVVARDASRHELLWDTVSLFAHTASHASDTSSATHLHSHGTVGSRVPSLTSKDSRHTGMLYSALSREHHHYHQLQPQQLQQQLQPQPQPQHDQQQQQQGQPQRRLQHTPVHSEDLVASALFSGADSNAAAGGAGGGTHRRALPLPTSIMEDTQEDSLSYIVIHDLTSSASALSSTPAATAEALVAGVAAAAAGAGAALASSTGEAPGKGSVTMVSMSTGDSGAMAAAAAEAVASSGAASPGGGSSAPNSGRVRAAAPPSPAASGGSSGTATAATATASDKLAGAPVPSGAVPAAFASQAVMPSVKPRNRQASAPLPRRLPALLEDTKEEVLGSGGSGAALSPRAADTPGVISKSITLAQRLAPPAESDEVDALATLLQIKLADESAGSRASGKPTDAQVVYASTLTQLADLFGSMSDGHSSRPQGATGDQDYARTTSTSTSLFSQNSKAPSGLSNKTRSNDNSAANSGAIAKVACPPKGSPDSGARDLAHDVSLQSLLVPAIAAAAAAAATGACGAGGSSTPPGARAASGVALAPLPALGATSVPHRMPTRAASRRASAASSGAQHDLDLGWAAGPASLSFSERPSTLGSVGGASQLGGAGGGGGGGGAAGGRGKWRVFIVQEFCTAGSLHEALFTGRFHSNQPERQAQVIDMRAILDTALDVARAMTYLHSKRLLHGDLKSKNVLLQACPTNTRGFIAKLGDYGCARMLGAEQQELLVSKFGAVTHMPPETIGDNLVTLATDVYSFGVLLFEMYCVEQPFAGYTPWQMIHAVVTNDERPQLPAHTPPGYAQLAADCMARDHAARPTFAEVVKRLERLVVELEPTVSVQLSEVRQERARLVQRMLSSALTTATNLFLPTTTNNNVAGLSYTDASPSTRPSSSQLPGPASYGSAAGAAPLPGWPSKGSRGVPSVHDL